MLCYSMLHIIATGHATFLVENTNRYLQETKAAIVVKTREGIVEEICSNCGDSRRVECLPT